MVSYVGSRELKNRLGRYLRMVREGATIYVTDRGHAIAELRPLAPPQTDEEGQLAALARDGLVAPRARARVIDRAAGVHVPGPSLSETIDAAREDRL